MAEQEAPTLHLALKTTHQGLRHRAALGSLFLILCILDASFECHFCQEASWILQSESILFLELLNTSKPWYSDSHRNPVFL